MVTSGRRQRCGHGSVHTGLVQDKFLSQKRADHSGITRLRKAVVDFFLFEKRAGEDAGLAVDDLRDFHELFFNVLFIINV